MENRVKFIKCKLIDIKSKNEGYGTDIILKNIEINENYIIEVDESIGRIKDKLKEQYEGNSNKDMIYLTRNMTNIDINANKYDEEWWINEEDFNYYVFNKDNILNFI